jgi:RNA polymerase sigma factor (sigma-70 family)
VDLDDTLAQLVAHSGDRLLRVAYQLTHDRAAAQDLVQEALLQVWRSMRRRGFPPEDWYAYLRRAVVNEYLRARRLRSSGEVVTDRMPERPVAGSPEDQIADRAQLWAALEGGRGRRSGAGWPDGPDVTEHWQLTAGLDIGASPPQACRSPSWPVPS